MNFNAEELSNTTQRIERLTFGGQPSINYYISFIFNDLNVMYGYVHSEDSNLADTCNELSGTFMSIREKVNSIGQDLVREITKYAQETLVNESGATQSLDEINGNLSTINSTLASI